MLAAAVTLVKPGGRIVFSNCSLDPLEGEDARTARSWPRSPMSRIDPILPGEIAGIDAFLTRAGHAAHDARRPATSAILRISGLDGFFAARFDGCLTSVQLAQKSRGCLHVKFTLV